MNILHRTTSINSKSGIRTKKLLDKGIHERVFPGAVLLAAHRGSIVFFQETGRLSLSPPGMPVQKDTIFDLASLTKPLATTLAVMKCVDSGRLDLDQPLESLLSHDLPVEKRSITTRFILAHCAGFSDWQPFYLRLGIHPSEKRKDAVRKWIMESPLAYPPGKGTKYSDLGFMILEWVIEACSKKTLSEFVEHHFFAPLTLGRTFFSKDTCPTELGPDQFAATEDCPWRKRVVQGFVHDENAYSLGGYSGHSGLFGTAGEVLEIASLLMLHVQGKREDYLQPETVKTFFTRQDIVPDSTWALGWDTPTTGSSSSGKYFSKSSIGHLGYTGTSLWLDPEQDLIVVFLTNRVHPTRKNEKIKQFRPLIHDQLMEDFVIHGRN